MTAGRPREVSRNNYTTVEVPPEVWERFGDFPIKHNRKYLYGQVPKHRLPRWVNSKVISIAKLVWLCHYPDHRFAPMEKIMYADSDTHNNSITNLYLGGT